MLFKSSAIAAIAAAPSLAAIQPGCAPKWRLRSDYSLGSVASAVITTTNGSGVDSTSVMHNFRCTHGVVPLVSHCPTYDPSDALKASVAWEDLGECSGNGPAPVLADVSRVSLLWRGVGCPSSWQNGVAYRGGDIVEVDGVVYECSSEQFVNTFCGMSGYKPGDSLYWNQAWKKLGSCSGFIAPTTSPVFASLGDAGGCPKDYQSGTSYKAGDTVTLGGNGVAKIVFKCEALEAGYCDLFPPGHDSKLGWKVLGYCSGKLRKSHLVVN
jgi:hypothetical protein